MLNHLGKYLSKFLKLVVRFPSQFSPILPTVVVRIT